MIPVIMKNETERKNIRARTETISATGHQFTCYENITCLLVSSCCADCCECDSPLTKEIRDAENLRHEMKDKTSGQSDIWDYRFEEVV